MSNSVKSLSPVASTRCSIPISCRCLLPGGSVLGGLDSLPWRRLAEATPAELKGQAGRQLASLVADIVAGQGFSAVLAPTHLLKNATDKFFGADRVVSESTFAAT